MLALGITEADVLDALREVYDPEVGITVVDLGLVYGITVDDGVITVSMTLTTPGCPLHDSIADWVQAEIETAFPEVRSVRVELVWDPPWSSALISEQGLRELGLA